MIVFFISCYTVSYYKSSMGHSWMIFLEFFFAYEINFSVIFCKVIRHVFYVSFNFAFICTFITNHIALSNMFFPCSQSRVISPSYAIYSIFHGYCVLNCLLNKWNPANSIRVALADSFSPEGVAAAFRQHCLWHHPHHWKQSRVPANWNYTYFAVSKGTFINFF